MAKDVVLLEVHPNKMKNKQYNLQALGLANLQGYIDKKEDGRIINKKEFRKELKRILKITYYKIDVIIKTFVALEVLIDYDKDYWKINPVVAPYVKIPVATVKYCINQLSADNFKIYCYLLNKYNIHTYYNHKENYFFSGSELLEMMGYFANDQKNRLKIKSSLDVLEQLGFIEYNHQQIGRPGKHGVYYELYKVNDTGTVQKKTAQEWVDTHEYISVDVAEDILLPEVYIDDQKKQRLENDLKQLTLGENQIQIRAQQAKEWIDSGATTYDFLSNDYKEAYDQIYG